MKTLARAAVLTMQFGVKKREQAPQIAQLLAVLTVAAIGLAAAVGFTVRGFEHSGVYTTIATGLLCFGLYMAGYGIDLKEARKHWRVVTIAITVGVIAKYLIIAGIAYAITKDIRYAVLGMAVAQMDPLSVAALNSDPRMSRRTKTVLNMWASFDDPVTALATPVLLSVLAGVGGFQLAAGANVNDTLLSLLPFALVTLGAGGMVVWRRVGGRIPATSFFDDIKKELRTNKAEGPKTAIVHSVLLGATVVRSAPLAALFSLFCRPAWLGGTVGALLTKTALYGATFLLGMLLSGGVDIAGGIVLGCATYLSQMIVAWLVIALSIWITPKNSRQKNERFSVQEVWHLALAQQNGITAIVLALVLQPSISIAVSAISLSILIANLANFIGNGVFDKVAVPRFWPTNQAVAED